MRWSGRHADAARPWCGTQAWTILQFPRRADWVCARVLVSFVTELMDLLARPETAGLRVGEKRGLFRKRFRCANCSADIPAENTAISEYKARLKLNDVTDSVSVVLAIPVLRCGACGKGQLADEGDLMQLFKALTHAFRSADVKPQ